MLALLRVILACALVFSSIILSGCPFDAGKQGEPHVNSLPTVRLISAPPESSETGFSVRLSWTGEDQDGVVEYYEYAWDDTSSWTVTFVSDTTFILTSMAVVDSFGSGCGGPKMGDCTYETADLHTFYIRAVDDRAGKSSIDYRTMSASNVLPVTGITAGQPPAEVPEGFLLYIEWEASDDDGTVMEYAYKLDYDPNYVPGSGEVHFTVLGNWVYVPPETTHARFYLGSWGGYRIRVRARDDAGGWENVFRPRTATEWRGNTNELKVVCWRTEGNPIGITIRSNIMGDRHTESPKIPRETFQGSKVFFTWEAIYTWDEALAEQAISGYQYAWDDTLNWSLRYRNNTRYPPLSGEGSTPDGYVADEELTIGEHTFYVKAFDWGGFSNVRTFPIAVYQGPDKIPDGARTIMIVDDWVDDWDDYYSGYHYYPDHDSCYTFWEDILSGFSVYEPSTRPGDYPIGYPLFWETWHEKYPNMPAILDIYDKAALVVLSGKHEDGYFTRCFDEGQGFYQNPLIGYVRQGGDLLVNGYFASNSMYLESGQSSGDRVLEFPPTEGELEAGEVKLTYHILRIARTEWEVDGPLFFDWGGCYPVGVPGYEDTLEVQEHLYDRRTGIAFNGFGGCESIHEIVPQTDISDALAEPLYYLRQWPYPESVTDWWRDEDDDIVVGVRTYTGTPLGNSVYFGFPFHVIEREQARAVADQIFGVEFGF